MHWLLDHARKHFEQFPDETNFMKYLGQVFQVSYASRRLNNKSEYSIYILNANKKPANRYGLHAEIIALYAPYDHIQARELSAIRSVQEEFQNRVHPIWTILISNDVNAPQHYDEVVESIGLEVYCIPFSRSEIENHRSSEFIFSRLEEYIRKRDLFAIQSPLQSDLFFFGRDSTVQDIISKIENGQNFGLFGLRKVGKTSVLFAVERYLDKLEGYIVIHIDCQLPSIYLRRWNALLAHICERINGQTYDLLGHTKQVEEFEKIIQDSPKRIVLIFDEIENIGFDNISPQDHWNEDFLPFWSTIRAVHQGSKGKLTFGVAGVNPHVFEVPLIQGKDNPFSLGVVPIYLQFLDEIATRNMIRTIGNYMGLNFEFEIFNWVFQQYGGHPLLTRKACSLIYQKVFDTHGPDIQLDDFISNFDRLDKQLDRDIRNILIVLAQHYGDEYDNLISLSKGETEWIEYVLTEKPYALDHILNYSVIERQNGALVFLLETVKRFLQRHGETLKETVKVLNHSSNPTSYNILPGMEQLSLWNRTGTARNQVEPKLRTLIYRIFLMSYGPKKGLENTLNFLTPNRQKELIGYNLKEILGGTSKALYLTDLKNIIMGDWDKFKHIFGNDRKMFELQLNTLNSNRNDAHANDIDENEVIKVENVANTLLQQMSTFLD